MYSTSHSVKSNASSKRTSKKESKEEVKDAKKKKIPLPPKGHIVHQKFLGLMRERVCRVEEQFAGRFR